MTISSTQTIRVMLVDDHTMVRKGLATFLKTFDDLELAGEAENGTAAEKQRKHICNRNCVKKTKAPKSRQAQKYDKTDEHTNFDSGNKSDIYHVVFAFIQDISFSTV